MVEVLRSILDGLLFLVQWDFVVAWLIVCVGWLIGARVGLTLVVLFIGVNLLCAVSAKCMFGVASSIDWSRTRALVTERWWAFIALAIVQTWITSAIIRGNQQVSIDAPDSRDTQHVREGQRTLIRLTTLVGALAMCLWELPRGVVTSAHSGALLFGVPSCLCIWFLAHLVLLVVQIPFLVVAMKLGMDRFAARAFVEGPLFTPVSLLPLFCYASWVAIKGR